MLQKGCARFTNERTQHMLSLITVIFVVECGFCAPIQENKRHAKQAFQ